jgi:hypothetical protein
MFVQVYEQDMLEKKTAALKDLKSRLEAHQRSLDEAEAVLEVEFTLNALHFLR